MKKIVVRITVVVCAVLLLVSCLFSVVCKEGLTYRVAHWCYHIGDVINNIGAKDTLEESKALGEADRTWTKEHDVVVHAAGMVDGYAMTNSREAFLLSYEKGARVFEIDLEATADGKAVCVHDWDMYKQQTGLDSVPSLDLFRESLIYDNYHGMDIEDLFTLMESHQDAWVVFDKIQSDERADVMIPQIIEAEKKHPGVLERCIVQFFDKTNFEYIDNLHHFDHYAFTTYRHATYDFEYMGVFCLEHGVEAMIINDNYVTMEQVDEMSHKGIRVYAFTVNDRGRFDEIKEWGGGVYSDVLMK